MAVQVLGEIGIEHRGESKSIERLWDYELDLVVTVCDDVNEECPTGLGQGRRLHMSFRDPAKAEGSEEEQLEVFRQIRNQIALKIPELLYQ